MREGSEDTRKRLLYLRLFAGIICVLGGLFWLGSEVLHWLKYGHWNIFSVFDVIGTFSSTSVLNFDAWLHEPHSWFGLHKLLHDPIKFIYNVFLFVPFSSIVIVIGGWLCGGCRYKLRKIEYKKLLAEMEKVKDENNDGRTPLDKNKSSVSKN